MRHSICRLVRSSNSSILDPGRELEVYDIMAIQTGSGAQTAEYEYSPLDEGHIRVLHLNPALTDEPLSGSLTHEPLKESGKSARYHAISYYWGPPVLDHSITLDGRRHYITATLYSALQGLRNVFFGEIVLLWADAICIDQNNTKEKNVQVAMMAEIYLMAMDVRVWLGDASPSDRLAF